jgi:hypothetical protein
MNQHWFTHHFSFHTKWRLNVPLAVLSTGKVSLHTLSGPSLKWGWSAVTICSCWHTMKASFLLCSLSMGNLLVAISINWMISSYSLTLAPWEPEVPDCVVTCAFLTSWFSISTYVGILLHVSSLWMWRSNTTWSMMGPLESKLISIP